MPECGRAESSHEKSGNTAAPATPQTRTQNTASASPPHIGCRQQSPHKQSPYQDPAAAQSTPATSRQAPPRAPACSANHPSNSASSSRGSQESTRGRESAPASPAPKAGKKTPPPETSDAYCASDLKRKRRSAAASSSPTAKTPAPDACSAGNPPASPPP